MDRPNYHQIYIDIINQRCPDQWQEYACYFVHSNLTHFEILHLNKLIFHPLAGGDTRENKRFKSYDRETILKILRYQKDEHISNSELAHVFGISRNTVAKWKKHYIV